MSYRTNKDQDFLDKVKGLQEEIVESRREFFKQVGKGAAATAVATTAMHMGVRPYMKPTVADAAAQAAPSYGTYLDAAAQGGWKSLFSIRPNYTFMNVGTTGSLPNEVLNRMEEWYNEVSETCAAYASNAKYLVETSKGFGYCKPDELIYTWTTSDGMNRLVYGQDWAKDDVMMTTNMEHIGGLGPIYGMENLFGIKAAPKPNYRWVDANTGAPVAGLNGADGFATNTKQNDAAVAGAVLVAVQQEDSAGGIVQKSPIVFCPTGVRRDFVGSYATNGYGVAPYFNYKAAVDANIANAAEGTAKRNFDDFQFEDDFIANNRAVNKLPLKSEMTQVAAGLNTGGKLKSFMWSSPPYLTGIRFPDKQMCNFTDTLNGGLVRTTIDNAHVPGMINVNFHDQGVDFAAGSGHKWQCGPGQSGMGYIRNGVKGQEAWTLSAGGETRTGTSAAYSTTKPLPKFWVQNHSYRRAGFAMAGGKRDNTFFVGDSIMQIGNNSIPINRAVYETHMLWNKIGRQKIEDYVVYVAQRLRMHLLNAPMFAGMKQWAAGGRAGAIAAGYDYDNLGQVYGLQNGVCAMGIDPRTNVKAGFNVRNAGADWDAYAAANGYTMQDLLDPEGNRADFPTASKCGLTGWNPWIYTTVTGTNGTAEANAYAADYNRPLTFAEASAENARSGGRLLSRLSDNYGIFTRNTRVPNQVHFNQPAAGVNFRTVYSLNNEGNFGTNNSSTPLRWSTHLFHTVDEIDNVGKLFSMENLTKDKVLADILTVR